MIPSLLIIASLSAAALALMGLARWIPATLTICIAAYIVAVIALAL